jgi:hypothetical protein
VIDISGEEIIRTSYAQHNSLVGLNGLRYQSLYRKRLVKLKNITVIVQCWSTVATKCRVSTC